MTISQFPLPEGGIPTGTTAQRPENPVTGDVFYDGTVGFLLIWDGTRWLPCSAPAAQPSITVTDVGTNIAYGTLQATVTFTEGQSGGKAAGFTAIQGSFTQTSTSSPVTLTITGNPGSYSFTGTAYNGFGTSPQALSTSVALTSVPQAPTIGSASTSSTSSAATVTWTLNNNGGKNLTAITITPYLNGTTAQTSQTAATTSSTSHTFTSLAIGSSYTFKVKTTNANGDSLESFATNSVTIPAVAEYLVVAGGGGNAEGQGSNREAGSGGGGLRTGTFSYVQGTTYTITVGAGGTGSTNGTTSSITGSGFTTISCTGGGKGGNNDNPPDGNGGNGGSGGGAWYSNTGGTGVSGEGFAGSNGFTNSPYGGAGGGAGGAGGRGTNNGPGVASSITGSSVTYAAGGKANDYPSTSYDANGAANTGTGASGKGNGGSGRVVIKASVAAASTTGSPSNPSTGLYIFNGNGSITF